MICCLNPGCQLRNPPCPDTEQYCTSCGTKLQLLSDRYRPLRRLGTGAFGVTYLAQDRQRFNKDCVIKQLIVHDLKAKELFEQEAKQLEDLGSKCSQIPSLLAYPSDSQYLYLVQEFIAGENLERYLTAHGVWNEEQIKEFLNSLLPVLELVHDNHVIHRDLKLENMMRRDDGKLVLIDFGVSKQLIINNTLKPGTIAGTPGYAPLEQMIKGIAKPASDLYSLGASCFHLLTGKHPYYAFEVDDYNWTSKWRQYLRQPISNDLGKILDILLQADYRDRYQSAREVIKAIQDLNPPISMPPTTPANPVSHLNHKTAWLNFYTAILSGVIALSGIALIAFNLQPKNPVITTSLPNNSPTETDPKDAITATTSPSNNNATAEEYYQRGLNLARKDEKGAIENYNQAIKFKPDYAEAYHSRGIAKSNLGDNRSAIEDYNQAIKLKPNYPEAYYNRGISKQLFPIVDSKGAIDDYNQAIKIKPDDADAYYNRGFAKSELGDKKKCSRGLYTSS